MGPRQGPARASSFELAPTQTLTDGEPVRPVMCPEIRSGDAATRDGDPHAPFVPLRCRARVRVETLVGTTASLITRRGWCNASGSMTSPLALATLARVRLKL